jgi:hypothetical protein
MLLACVVVCVVVSAGCIPVQTVLGRPAAVLAAHSDVELSYGVGVTEYDVSLGEGIPDDAPGTEDEVIGSVHVSAGAPIEGVADFWGGINNGQWFGCLRLQVLGEPVNAPRPHETSFDVSAEAGASTTITYLLFDVEYIPFSDVHMGANASLRIGRVTLYGAYRHHWGAYTYEDPDALEGEVSYLNTFYRQDMVFAGIEFRPRRKRRVRPAKVFAIEYFFGATVDPSGEPDQYSARVRGVNLIFTPVRW